MIQTQIEADANAAVPPTQTKSSPGLNVLEQSALKNACSKQEQSRDKHHLVDASRKDEIDKEPGVKATPHLKPDEALHGESSGNENVPNPKNLVDEAGNSESKHDLDSTEAAKQGADVNTNLPPVSNVQPIGAPDLKEQTTDKEADKQ